jgi:hypothetical protein
MNTVIYILLHQSKTDRGKVQNKKKWVRIASNSANV